MSITVTPVTEAVGAEISGDVSPSSITLHLDVIRRSLDPAVELFTRLVSEPSFDEAELDFSNAPARRSVGEGGGPSPSRENSQTTGRRFPL